jgi:hypothetical protein
MSGGRQTGREGPHEVAAQFSKAGCDQPTDMHLTGSDLLDDLRLTELFEEPQMQDLALPWTKAPGSPR